MHAFRLFWDKEDYKLEKNVPGLTRSTFTASACVRLFNISKMQLFVCFSTRDKRMVVAKNSNTREARVNVGLMTWVEALLLTVTDLAAVLA